MKVNFEQGNSSKTYTYTAICQTAEDSEMDVRILCPIKVINSNKLFIVNTEELELYVKLHQILEVLPIPEMKFSGERMYYYNFPMDIAVCEK